MNASVKGFGYVAAGMRGLGATAVLSNPSLFSSASSLAPAPVTYDPCAIAQQTPCPAPRSLTQYTPPPGKAPSQVPEPVLLSTIPSSTQTAGFSQWGLLAALAVGGVVVYAVAHKKKAS